MSRRYSSDIRDDLEETVQRILLVGRDEDPFNPASTYDWSLVLDFGALRGVEVVYRSISERRPAATSIDMWEIDVSEHCRVIRSNIYSPRPIVKDVVDALSGYSASVPDYYGTAASLSWCLGSVNYLEERGIVRPGMHSELQSQLQPRAWMAM